MTSLSWMVTPIWKPIAAKTSIWFFSLRTPGGMCVHFQCHCLGFCLGFCTCFLYPCLRRIQWLLNLHAALPQHSQGCILHLGKFPGLLVQRHGADHALEPANRSHPGSLLLTIVTCHGPPLVHDGLALIGSLQRLFVRQRLFPPSGNIRTVSCAIYKSDSV